VFPRPRRRACAVSSMYCRQTNILLAPRYDSGVMNGMRLFWQHSGITIAATIIGEIIMARFRSARRNIMAWCPFARDRVNVSSWTASVVAACV